MLGKVQSADHALAAPLDAATAASLILGTKAGTDAFRLAVELSATSYAAIPRASSRVRLTAFRTRS
jgi:hypothetical protein